jgi:ComF family protein
MAIDFQPEEEAATITGMAAMFGDIGRWTGGHLRYLADLVLPPVCVHCHEPLSTHGVLCAACWREIEFITPPLCDRLGLPLYHGDGGEPLVSAVALGNPPVFRRARAATRFTGVMRDLVHGFKYSDRHEALGLFAGLMQGAGADLLRDADMLVPVPLHRRKLFQRRYNQAALLARKLSALSGAPANYTALRRIRGTPSQVGLPEHERRANVAEAFAVPLREAEALRGRTVLLVDDVITTGSTLNACARALLDAGAANVDCLAIAMVASDDRESNCY